MTMLLTSTESLGPNVVRRKAAKENERPVAASVNGDGQVRKFTFGDIDKASDEAAWFLNQTLAQGDVINFAYMGPSDVRYLVWVLGAMKTGKCVALPSPGNTPGAIRQFFQTVGVKVLIHAPELAGMLAELIRGTQEDGIRSWACSGLDEVFHGEHHVEPFPFDCTYDEIKDKSFMCLHTSGTSGHPKPIFWNHRAVLTLGSELDPVVKKAFGSHDSLLLQLMQRQNMLAPFPFFHLGGIGTLFCGIFYDATFVYPLPGTQLNPQNITTMLQAAECTTTCMPPSILEAMLSHPPGLDALSKLDHVAYSGGPLNPQRGEQLAQHVKHLFPLFGSTEGGSIHLMASNDKLHWKAFKMAQLGQKMEEVFPGLFELVIPRTESVNIAYGYFHTNPDPEICEVRTKDLFSPVPGQEEEKEEGWWEYRGRVDNWVTMSNGLKFDPTDLEACVMAHPDVAGALVAGSGRFRLCLLVQLKSPPVSPQDARKATEDLWPTVAEANQKTPKFGRVPKELIVFARADKPFERAGKGTIQRRLTIATYDEEIEKLYQDAEEGLLTSGLEPLKSTGKQDLIALLRTIYKDAVSDRSGGGGDDDDDDDDKAEEIGIQDNLFEMGLDSLSAFIVVARLKAALRAHGTTTDQKKKKKKILDRIDNRLVYSTATIENMADALAGMLSSSSSSSEKDENDVLPSQAQLRQSLIEKYTNMVRDLPPPPSPYPQCPEKEEKDQVVILLTGSTGSLGSYILSNLLSPSPSSFSSSPNRKPISKIYCLNRSPSAKEKQFASFKSRGLSIEPLLLATTTSSSSSSPSVVPKVIFLHSTDLSAPRLGLADNIQQEEKDIYETLRRETTHIIHNAFPVNFLLGLQAGFESHIKGLVNLLSLASSSSTTTAGGGGGASMYFISSISAVVSTTPPPIVVAAAAASDDDGEAAAAEVVMPPVIEEAVTSPMDFDNRESRDGGASGYAQAKHICEVLLQVYANNNNNKASGTGQQRQQQQQQQRKVAILRAGQICGPVFEEEEEENGGDEQQQEQQKARNIECWNKNEWLPSLVRSSAHMGAAPGTLGGGGGGGGGAGVIDWMPVDCMGRVIREIVLMDDDDDDDDDYEEEDKDKEDRFRVFNLVNPTKSSWEDDILPAVKRVVKGGKVVSAAEWVEMLVKEGEKGKGAKGMAVALEENPALKMVDFYKGMMMMMMRTGKGGDTEVRVDNMLRASRTAREQGKGGIPGIREGHMMRWIRSWGL